MWLGDWVTLPVGVCVTLDDCVTLGVPVGLPDCVSVCEGEADMLLVADCDDVWLMLGDTLGVLLMDRVIDRVPLLPWLEDVL